MEEFSIPINKGERRLIHLKPDEPEALPVNNGINFNLDTLQLKYDNKYAGTMVTFNYADADGREVKFSKPLEQGGVMSWINDKSIAHPNFGYIRFISRMEVFFEFSFD